MYCVGALAAPTIRVTPERPHRAALRKDDIPRRRGNPAQFRVATHAPLHCGIRQAALGVRPARTCVEASREHTRTLHDHAPDLRIRPLAAVGALRDPNGMQHAMLLSVNLVLIVIVFRRAGAGDAATLSALSLGMIALAISTVLQSMRKGPVGSGYLAPPVFSAIYIGPAVLAAGTGGLPAVFGMTMFAGLVEISLAPLLRRLRALFPPAISGFIVVIVGLQLGMARPCFGSTIALRHETLAGIGGFEAFAGYIADDYAIGEAVRAAGMKVAIPSLVLAHSCTERSAVELLRHELRWVRTLRAVAPAGYAGMVITHPLPFALLGAWLSGFGIPGMASVDAL